MSEDSGTTDRSPEQAVADEPWIETKEGGLFFVNALFVVPAFCVMVPLSVRTLLTLVAGPRGESPFLDTIPMLANLVLPYVGWILILPVATTLMNLHREKRLLPRVTLLLFLIIHLSFFAYTVYLWGS